LPLVRGKRRNAGSSFRTSTAEHGLKGKVFTFRVSSAPVVKENFEFRGGSRGKDEIRMIGHAGNMKDEMGHLFSIIFGNHLTS
jgi:hypothetical protein